MQAPWLNMEAYKYDEMGTNNLTAYTATVLQEQTHTEDSVQQRNRERQHGGQWSKYSEECRNTAYYYYVRVHVPTPVTGNYHFA